MTVYFNFLGQYSEANFARDEYVSVKFPDKKLGTKKFKKPDYKEKVRDIAISAGIGGGVGHLLARKAGGLKQLGALGLGATIGGGAAYLSSKKGLFAKKDMDGRSDKGKKRNKYKNNV